MKSSGGRKKPLKVLPHYSISWESDEDTTDKGGTSWVAVMIRGHVLDKT
jgi:hypothetical protein